MDHPTSIRRIAFVWLLSAGCTFSLDRALLPGDLRLQVQVDVPQGTSQTTQAAVGASVQLVGSSITQTTDSSGRAVIHSLAAGTYALNITYAQGGSVLGTLTVAGITIAPGNGIDLGSIKLGASGSIHGQVLLGGAPVPFASLQVLAPDGYPVIGLPVVESDSAGNYSFPYLPAGSQVVRGLFTATSDGTPQSLTATSAPVQVVQWQTSQANIVLMGPVTASPANLDLSAIAPAGVTPPSTVTVSLTPQSGSAITVTQPAAMVAIPNVPAGVYTVDVSASGFQTLTLPGQMLVGAVELGDLLLQPEPTADAGSQDAGPVNALPGAPTSVVATAGDGKATVTWAFPASAGESAITSYTVTASPGGASATASGTTAIVTRLSNGTAYTFTVTATNTQGTGPASAPSNSIVPLGAPGAPTIVSVTAGDTEATVTWTAPDDGGATITSYTVTASSGATQTVMGTLTATFTNLTNGTSYTFTVYATNAVGNGTASAVSSPVVPATLPDPPTGVTAVAGVGEATVSWTLPASDGGDMITGYLVVPMPGAPISVPVGTSYVVTGLIGGQSYTFTVAAVTAAGTGSPSSPSNSVTPTGVPGAPTAVQAVAGVGQATISFTPPASTGGSPILSYTATSTPGGFSGQAAASPIVVTGLTSGQSYTFAVTASNAIGAGPAGASNSVTIESCSAGTVDCNGTCVDLTSDVNNCGACGHVCSTTSPSQAACNQGCLVTLSAGGTGPHSIALDSSNVYWTDFPAGLVLSVPLGGGVPQTLAQQRNEPAGITVDSNNVYWTDYAGGEVLQEPSGGGAITTLASGQGIPTAISVDATYVYWANQNPGGIVQAAIGGASVVTLVSGDGPVAIVNDQDNLYWLDLDANTQLSSLMQLSKAGGTPTTLASSQTGATQLAQDTGNLYWNTSTDVDSTGAVMVMPKAGGTPVTLASQQNGPQGLAVDGTNVYWADYTTPTLMTVSTGGGTALTLTTATGPEGVAVNSTSLFWTDPLAGSVMMLTPKLPAIGPPGAPIGIVVTPGNGQVTVSWMPPAHDGGSPITGYVVTLPDGTTIPATGTSVVVPGLTSNQSYSFTVSAVNAIGTGPASTPSSAVSPTGEPDAPTNVTGMPGNGQVMLAWDKPNPGASAITYYTVTESPDDIQTKSTTNSVTITGLQNGTPYTFTVTATNTFGTGPASQPPLALTPATAPGPPTGVSAATMGNQVTVSWVPPIDNGGAAVTSYTVYANGVQVATSTSASAPVSGLTTGVSYTFTVTATNPAGTSVPSAGSSPLTVQPNCASGQTACSGTCTDLTSDPNNCGFCGNVCPANAPSTAVCQNGAGCLITIASGQGGANTITSDGTNFYWSDESANSVWQAPVVGGTPILLGSDTAPNWVRPHGANVYWADQSAIWEANVGGGGAHTIVSGQNGILGLVLDSSNIYWVTEAGGTLVKQSLTGGSPVTIATGLGQGEDLAIDSMSTNAYVSTVGGAIVSVPLAGGIPQTLTSASSNIYGDSIDSSSVYWTSYTLGTVMEMPLTGGTPVTLAANQGSPLGVVADAAGNVYWTNSAGNGGVVALAKGGSTPVTLWSGSAQWLDIDAESVFWTAFSNGVVYRYIPVPALPPPPVSVTATPLTSGGEVSVSWIAPNSFLDNAITSYSVTVSPGGQSKTVPGSATSATFSGLTSGPAYTFSVTAKNATGTSPAATTSPPLQCVLATQCLGVETDCGGCACSNLATDANNCGACGNVCQVNAPSTASCTSTPGCLVALAGNRNVANSITADANNVYWSESTDIVQIPRFGGPPRVIASGLNNGAGVASDGTHVYWSSYNDGVIGVSPVGGGAATTLATTSSPWGFALDSKNVYWTSYNNGTVLSVPKSGGGITTLASGQGSPTGLAVDGENAYWGTYATNGSGSILEASLAGGAPLTLATGQSGVYGVVVDATSVYWADTIGGVIASVPIGGGLITTIASGQASPVGVVVDATSVYWSNSGASGGGVMAAPLTGGTPTTLWGGSPQWLFADSGSLYWTVYTADEVFQLTPASETPAAPTGVTALSAGTQALVSWTAPTSPLGNRITSYTVKASAGGLTVTVPGTQAAAMVPGLATGTSYTFTVTATNATGTSPASAPSSALVPCAPGFTWCGSSCVDTSVDVNNCGACGAVCTAAAPSTATCQGGCLLTLAEGTGPNQLTVDAHNVYFTATLGTTVVNTNVVPNGQVIQVPIGGGTPVTLANLQSWPIGIANDTHNVYWADYGSGQIMSAPIGGGTAATLLAGGQGNGSVLGAGGPWGVATDGTWVYWSFFENCGGPCAPPISKVPVGGGGVLTLATVGSDYPSAMTSDGTNLYLSATEYNGGGQVWQISESTGAVLQLAGGQAEPTGIAVDAHNVYWANYYNVFQPDHTETVNQIAIGGAGSITSVGTGLNRATSVAVDSQNVYWIDAWDELVMAAPIGGGTTITVASNQEGLQSPLDPSSVEVPALGWPSLAADSKNLYWTNPGAGTVMQFSPKTPAVVPPSAPLDPIATGGNGKASVSWTPPLSNGGAAISGYVVIATPGGALATTSGGTSVVVPGLVDGTSYMFVVFATNRSGVGAGSSPSNAVTGFACPAGEVQCGTQCTNLQTDSNNCGVCGNVCAATAPSTVVCNGGCLETLTYSPGGVSVYNDMALDSTNVYYSQASQSGPNGIFSIPTKGGTPVELTSAAPGATLALSGGNLYWLDSANGDQVLSIPAGSSTGGAVTTLVNGTQSGGNVSGQIAADASNVYWIRGAGNDFLYQTSTTSPYNTIQFAAQPPASFYNTFRNVVSDGSDLWWLVLGQQILEYVDTPSGVPGGTPNVLDGIGNQPYSLAVDSHNLYWVDGNFSVYQQPKLGGSPILLINESSNHFGYSLAVDAAGGNVYAAGTNVILRVPIGGGAITTMATPNEQVFGLTTDATSLYWVQSGGISAANNAVIRLTPK